MIASNANGASDWQSSQLATSEDSHSFEGVDDPRFVEMVQAIGERQREASFGLGELFSEAAEIIKTEGKFGDCESVRDFIEKYARTSWSKGHRLIFAADFRQSALKAGLQEPVNET